jgi:phage tail-like protein
MFEVEIDDIEIVGWHEITLPSNSVEEARYREEEGEERWGEYAATDLVMERGMAVGDHYLWEWRNAVRESNATDALRNLVVYMLDEEGARVLAWEFMNAWVKDYDPPELEASSDPETSEVATETVTIAYDEMTRSEV